MPEIFHHPPPPHHEMHPHLQPHILNQFPSPGICPFTSSSVDELSQVTFIIEKNHNLKKRKLEFDVIEVDSQKQSVEGDSSSVEPPMANTNKRHGNSKPKPDYIHVRARRGQATDSHSLAERARREKIKKKMQFLQDLVPGCNKITNKAAILDEIITYVQGLQSEVEFLTMKLAASTTSLLDFQYE